MCKQNDERLSKSPAFSLENRSSKGHGFRCAQSSSTAMAMEMSRVFLKRSPPSPPPTWKPRCGTIAIIAKRLIDILRRTTRVKTYLTMNSDAHGNGISRRVCQSYRYHHS